MSSALSRLTSRSLGATPASSSCFGPRGGEVKVTPRRGEHGSGIKVQKPHTGMTIRLTPELLARLQKAGPRPVIELLLKSAAEGIRVVCARTAVVVAISWPAKTREMLSVRCNSKYSSARYACWVRQVYCTRPPSAVSSRFSHCGMFQRWCVFYSNNKSCSMIVRVLYRVLL